MPMQVIKLVEMFFLYWLDFAIYKHHIKIIVTDKYLCGLDL